MTATAQKTQTSREASGCHLCFVILPFDSICDSYMNDLFIQFHSYGFRTGPTCDLFGPAISPVGLSLLSFPMAICWIRPGAAQKDAAREGGCCHGPRGSFKGEAGFCSSPVKRFYLRCQDTIFYSCLSVLLMTV